MSIEPKFTYDKPTKDDYIALIGAGPRKYCLITQPTQCKKDPKDPTLIKRCQEEFEKCFEEARRFELWHRTN
ncbi:MAG: hypothetical protein JSS32_00300 [Verrucomicrobia bacterium]|nr:hypothetical protein [Verrucomicrobiota bacterium]